MQGKDEGLASDVMEAWNLVHDASYARLGEMLPPLLRRAETRARAEAESQRRATYALVSDLYQLLAAALAKLGEPDMGWLAADRAVRAAEMAENPPFVSAALYRMAHVFLSNRQLERSRTVAASGIRILEPMRKDAPPEIWSLWGALHLVTAIVAVRQDDSRLALDAMRKAEMAAERVKVDRNDFHTEFGPTNVALHAVAVAVELGDAGEALRRAQAVDASHLSRERRARFLLDVARAHGQRRQSAEALRALLEAEALTPEQVASHVLVRELIRDLLRREGGRVSPELQGLARRTGILP
jgi:tetratricopeptide (TPR) repeat protein